MILTISCIPYFQLSCFNFVLRDLSSNLFQLSGCKFFLHIHCSNFYSSLRSNSSLQFYVILTTLPPNFFLPFFLQILPYYRILFSLCSSFKFFFQILPSNTFFLHILLSGYSFKCFLTDLPTNSSFQVLPSNSSSYTFFFSGSSLKFFLSNLLSNSSLPFFSLKYLSNSSSSNSSFVFVISSNSPLCSSFPFKYFFRLLTSKSSLPSSSVFFRCIFPSSFCLQFFFLLLFHSFCVFPGFSFAFMLCTLTFNLFAVTVYFVPSVTEQFFFFFTVMYVREKLKG